MDDEKFDTEVCKYCLTELEWCGDDDVCGTLWCCEECMEYFCERCFVDHLGRTALTEMLKDDKRRILCPDCLAKEER